MIALIGSPARLGPRITAAAAAATVSVPSGFLSAVVFDRAANAPALSRISRPYNLVLTDAGTPTVTISADLLALSVLHNGALISVTIPYRLAISGAIIASLAATIVSENTVVRSSLTGFTIAHTASAITANIGAIKTLVGLGAIASITLDRTSGIPQMAALSIFRPSIWAQSASPRPSLCRSMARSELTTSPRSTPASMAAAWLLDR